MESEQTPTQKHVELLKQSTRTLVQLITQTSACSGFLPECAPNLSISLQIHFLPFLRCDSLSRDEWPLSFAFKRKTLSPLSSAAPPCWSVKTRSLQPECALFSHNFASELNTLSTFLYFLRILRKAATLMINLSSARLAELETLIVSLNFASTQSRAFGRFFASFRQSTF